MTLAHELGHGIHARLSREQSYLEFDTSLVVAELASTFGEMLTFHELMERTTDPRVRLTLLAQKIEDSFATVFRQAAMHQFELRAAHPTPQRGRTHHGNYRRNLDGAAVGDVRRLSGNDGELPALVGIYPALHPRAVLRLRLPLRRTAVALALPRLSAAGRAFCGCVSRHAGGRRQRNSRATHATRKHKPPIPAFWHGGLDIIHDMVQEAKALAEV